MNHYDAHKESIKGKVLTAYELADAMDKKGFRYREVKAAVKMLRQQQAEIEALKKNLDVALMIVDEPAKTLTDEEIVEVINEHGWRGLTGYLLTFAHAILRKASEK